MWEETRESSGRFFGTHPYNGVGSILSRRDMLVLLACDRGGTLLAASNRHEETRAYSSPPWGAAFLSGGAA